jgi:membrane-bound lytic murein transglycosylase A
LNRRNAAALLSGGAVWGMAVPVMSSSPVLSQRSFSDLPGWAGDDHAEALAAFRRSSAEMLEHGRAFDRPVQFGGDRADWMDICRRALTASDPRSFFESEFTPLAVADPARPEGLFTGYFEPQAPGSLVETAAYRVPVFRKPPELVSFDADLERQSGLKYGKLDGGRPEAYFTRREIEQGALKGRGLEIVWLTDWADAFFIHIQGSGRVALPDGTFLRLAYGGKNGRPYTGIGGLLVERGIFSREEMSMQSTRAWMAKHPAEARELMWQNQSYIFFREVPIDDSALGAPGAQYVSLTPRRSLAVDRSLWMFGTPVWLDTTTPSGTDGAMEPFRHLMVAQDTGTAIRGHVRGDVFWGTGEHAALAAGHMKSPGRMVVLLPRPLAARLLALQ